MHFLPSATIFVTITCGLSAAQSWRDPSRSTFSCGSEFTAVCHKDTGPGGYSAIVATRVTKGSGNPSAPNYNCLGSNAKYRACCNPGFPGLLGESQTWTDFTNKDFDEYHCGMKERRPHPRALE
ncbi:hypothetical protein MJO28_002106 [Puccinia striiformis f. sp. tritici]|uniref:Uncharacterized protein n=3 Tax=Puccinia striiformis TaxID=27350 RepID=A0A2S4WLM9_9BASI|nr:hypothetical protein Pst134EA_002658 [Puccinia striiformis f. sp. tritici]KAI9610105.1 hypothetical protein H4Q26_007103 [Puccinia striiformis f. sp. tritici PST-130]POW12617.1 hypothetical protein PSTT_04245 [Puccinia striiformis]KAH9464250.1 hypothetical protein Pst134EB_003781 [Puccinia striiformis f. sp. tritici]KAH9472030.1 hypothetical protein Pst134EA_002658 [Puccinia striiformis f. sp. tritici]KAI7961617.1 hypothetical protein MJO28_002106 [Puccinia striiformis f. sp. tritici]